MNDQALEQLRVPPQSVEAEQNVLGGIMLAPDAFDRIADILVPEDFYRRDHQLIYRALMELAEKGKPLDAVTVGEWFESMNLAEHVGGGAYLIELATTVWSAANIKAYAEIVRDKAILRQLIDVGTGIVNSGFMPDGRESAEIINEAEANILAINRRAASDDAVPGLVGLKNTVAELSRRRANHSDLLGISTTLDAVDELTMGLQATDLIILAARPSMGKSAAMLQMERGAAKAGFVPYTGSMEMSDPQLFMRHIAAMARVDFDKVQRPHRCTPQEMERIRDAIKRMKEWRWYHDTRGSMTVEQIVSRLRREKRQHGIDIAFIDYLQFVDISKHLRNGIPAAIQHVTRTLKATAKELNIPIVLLSQLNRGVENRPDKRPNMSDLRESGAIEQDADLIIFLHRQGYYEKDWPKDDPRQNVCEWIIAKSRNGRTGTETVQWMGKYQQFNNLSYESLPPNYYESRKGGRGFEAKPTHGLVKRDDD